MLLVYESFWPSYQEDDAAGGLCSEFDSDSRRKNIVYDEFSISRLMSTRYVVI